MIGASTFLNFNMRDRIKREQVELLAKELFSEAENDPSWWHEAVMDMSYVELYDVLRRAIQDDPTSEFAIEVKRRTRQLCKKEAVKIANQIISIL